MTSNIAIGQPGKSEDLCCKDDTGEVNETMGLVCFILNCIWFGSGTIIAGLVSQKGPKFPAILIGLVQMFLVVIGWIWSIIHGYHIWMRSKGKK